MQKLPIFGLLSLTGLSLLLVAALAVLGSTPAVAVDMETAQEVVGVSLDDHFKKVTIIDNRLESQARIKVEPGQDQTVGTLLLALGFQLDPQDLVYPQIDQPVPWYGRVYFNRAPGVQLTVDGESREYKTHAATVASFLSEQKVKLDEDDRVEPAKTDPIVANLSIRVFRVETEEITEEESIAYSTEYQADDSRYEGEEVVKTEGVDGKKELKYKVTTEDGNEVDRELLEEKVLNEPVVKIVLQGTKSRPTASTPSGPANGSYADMINAAASKYGVNAQELHNVMMCESGGNPAAYNPYGPYYGLFQFNAGMFDGGPYGSSADIYNPHDQIYNAAYYFSIGGRGRWGC